jgi:hypothetical protein
VYAEQFCWLYVKIVYNDEVVVERVQFLNGYVHVPGEERLIMRSLKRPPIYCLERQGGKFPQLYLKFEDRDRLNQGREHLAAELYAYC